MLLVEPAAAGQFSPVGWIAELGEFRPGGDASNTRGKYPVHDNKRERGCVSNLHSLTAGALPSSTRYSDSLRAVARVAVNRDRCARGPWRGRCKADHQ